MKKDVSSNKSTACLALADGTLFFGKGFGSTGETTAELCFNTSITGYQEILTDPSYASQIITFTFPHIGNVGVNIEDAETQNPAAEGLIVKWDPTQPSNWRSLEHLSDWLSKYNLLGMGGVDTRRLTRAIRMSGAPHVALAHNPDGNFDTLETYKKSKTFFWFRRLRLSKKVTCHKRTNGMKCVGHGQKVFERQNHAKHKVVAIDYGAKRNILRCLASAGCEVIVVPASSSADEVLAHKPDGVFLSNGPGDPAATGMYAVPVIQHLLENTDLPMFGICLGHQMLALALGAKTIKMNHGHHGANHPVKEHSSGKVEITSMNHGFAVDAQTLPDGVEETHVSLFDGSNCGIKMSDRPVFFCATPPRG